MGHDENRIQFFVIRIIHNYKVRSAFSKCLGFPKLYHAEGEGVEPSSPCGIFSFRMRCRRQLSASPSNSPNIPSSKSAGVRCCVIIIIGIDKSLRDLVHLDIHTMTIRSVNNLLPLRNVDLIPAVFMSCDTSATLNDYGNEVVCVVHT